MCEVRAFGLAVEGLDLVDHIGGQVLGCEAGVVEEELFAVAQVAEGSLEFVWAVQEMIGLAGRGVYFLMPAQMPVQFRHGLLQLIHGIEYKILFLVFILDIGS
jgi:hypothetical protein